MMAGAVPPGTRKALQQRVKAARGDYPWEAVLDTVLAEPVNEARLVQRGLSAQRDWITGPMREPVSRKVRRKSKSLVAWLLSRVIFFVLYTVAAIALLVFLRLRWNSLDVYAIGDALKRAFPQVFGSV